MPAPKVLDARGNPLSVGSRVSSHYGPAEVVDLDFDGDWPALRIETQASRRGVKFRLAYYTDDPSGYCAESLELIDQYDKEESRGD